MRIAIISDIHGNCFALDIALADIRENSVDQIVCLGDAIQGGAQPAQTVARLREIKCPVVIGNADAWLLTGKATGKESVSSQQIAVREWSLAQLTDDDRKFIESWGTRPTIEIDLGDGKKLLCFHGSPYSFDDIILPETSEEDFRQMLDGYEALALAGGHTHTQQIRRLDDSIFLNPGSIGFAYAHNLPDDAFHADAWTEYAILSYDDARVALEFRRVPYDADELIRIILASGRPFAEERAGQYRR
jgi:predicted phosphodiesterase